MTLTTRTKWTLLGGLLLAWVVLAWVQIMNQPEPQRVPLTHKSGPVKATAEAGPPAMSRTRSATGQYRFTTPKNIFAPLPGHSEMVASKSTGSRMRRGKMGGAPTPSPMPGQPEAPAVRPLTAEEQAILEARQQLSEYRFLGYLTQHGARRAFLAKGPETYILKIGETLGGGRILLTAMDANSVTLVETGTNQKASIPLAQHTDNPEASSTPAPAPEAPKAPDNPPPTPPAPEPPKSENPPATTPEQTPAKGAPGVAVPAAPPKS